MPTMTDEEKQELQVKIQFLYDKGYTFGMYNEYGFDLTNKIIRVDVYSGRYDTPDVGIRFIAKNECFGIDWISFIMDKERNIKHKNVIEILSYFLDFFRENYDQLININFCYGIREKVVRAASEAIVTRHSAAFKELAK
ncbi:MAG: hypothetical protein LBV04_00830 [Deferribacteraceae bacterium]|jgi:hypothetical protein|nr:hypothetical protein [Deferribacteraceae bacterium]